MAGGAGGSIGFPAFDAPPWALRVFILDPFLGFPVALVMAWVFDITPEGVKVDAERTAASACSPRRRAGRAGAGLVFLRPALLPQRRRGHAGSGRSEFDRGAALRQHERQADEDYFSDGMTEELLNVLAKCRS